MIEVKNLSFSYNKKPIINNISFEIRDDEIVGLVAPSGYGKSTLGKIISGYIRDYAGDIIVDGKNISDISGFFPVQMVHQSPEKNVDNRWKIRKILNEGWKVDKKTKEELGIEEFWLDKFPVELSGGELQRVLIARILSPNTKYIVADEISTMLDSITQLKIMKVLKDINKKRNIGILLISHNKSLVEKMSDRIIDLEYINNKSRD
ncbi:MAG: ATP-binding cassette domain-containing protein [Tissierellia bacterium]|nr:ATP-binding cassette domain-containing protein [Tissierellia bacterium]